MSASVRLQVLFAIRDARGLTSQEKAFLFVVESRGLMKTAWEKSASDMGLKRDAFYKARASLKAKGLLTVWPQDGATSWYSVNAELLADYGRDSDMRNVSADQNGDSADQNGDSADQNGDSGMTEHKENRKGIRKVTTKSGGPAPSGPPEVGSYLQQRLAARKVEVK